MKILVLTFYFQPDLGAGSFRTTALVEELRDAMPPGSHVDVVTTLPNRYNSLSAEAPELERLPGLEIHRIALPSHRSGMVDQSKAFLAFSWRAMRHVAGRDYDLVLATSSRLMTAVLGAWVARRKKAVLYLDIRDIFVDTIKDVLPKQVALFARPLFSLLEGWVVRRAARVNLVSRGFAGYFSSRYASKKLSHFTNGIDDEFIRAAPPSVGEEYATNNPVRVVYAGNVGEGQGLHAILPALGKRMADRVRFQVIGDGGRMNVLRQALAASKTKNVELLSPLKRDALIDAYRQADVLFLHLNGYEAFEKVLPSKLFEYGAMGKPVWAGIAGYAAEFVCTEISNSAVFAPCDVEEAERVFGTLELRVVPRADFVSKYARRRIMAEMAQEIVATAESTCCIDHCENLKSVP